MVEAHVERQLRLVAELPALLAAGAADWRSPVLLEASRRLCARPEVLAGLPAEAVAPLARLVEALPARLDELAACGLPDTLVHGDLHPGNVLAGPAGPVLLDWGDAVVGPPLLDFPALCHGFEPAARREVGAQVQRAWQRRLPGADVARAMALLPPLAELRQALVYQRYLDDIEPAERHYHRADVPARLQAAVRAAGPPR